jgi:arginine decarboxylase
MSYSCPLHSGFNACDSLINVVEPSETNATPRVSSIQQAIDEYHANERHSFHMPGHKQQAAALHPEAQRIFGAQMVANDLSEMGGFDYLHAPDSSIVVSQQRAAEVFGAAQTWFLVNGSTGGNLAAITALASDDDTVVMLRASHRSVYGGVVLAGANPTYVPMQHNESEDGWFIGNDDLLDTLETSGHGSHVAALHLTRPNYYGMAVDMDRWVETARRLDVPLIVDEAHGSHFAFDKRLPEAALALGADITIQSTHKTLGGLTQASMLHVSERGLRWAERLGRSAQQLQSSSPSALLTISLALAAEHMRAEGTKLVGQAVDFGEHVSASLAAPLRGVRIEKLATDPTKVVIDVRPISMTGFAAAQWLRSERKLWVELADQHRIVCSITLGDTRASVDALLDALNELSTQRGTAAGQLSPQWVTSQRALPPRRALQAKVESVPLAQSVDRVVAEYLIPYPPGIPLAVPGEVLTAEVMTTLLQYQSIGSRIVGPTDGSLATLLVVA